MNLIITREDLRVAPDIREPDSEAIHARPEEHAASLRAKLPVGTTVTEVRRVDYIDDLNDRCTALLLGVGEPGRHLYVINELGEDNLGEMAAAGRALATVLGVPFVEGEPAHWPRHRASFLARFLGYAA